jgi:uncharacterized SAM-binding protein YcdF (DUF218 family)
MTYIEPLLPVFLLLTIVGWFGGLGAVRNKRPRLLLLAIVGMFLISWPPVSWLLLQPFEHQYSYQPPSAGQAHVIVVLSSYVYPPGPGRPFPVADQDTYERCRYAAWLYANEQRIPVLASGGGIEHRTPFAETMKHLLAGEGVPASMIWVEDHSRNTFESAVNVAEILREKGISRIVLVTEAYHMARAERCFRKQGLQVTPAACHFNVLDITPEFLLPSAAAIEWNERVLHESLGLLWYAVSGRI